MTPLFSRMMLAFKAGLQFAGKRNLYDVFGYPRALTTEHLLAKYQRQDLTSRIVNMAPEEMWSQRPQIIKPSGIDTKWDTFVARHSLYDKLIQADKLCAFGKFSVLWLGLKGQISSPAPKTSSLDDILYIQAYGGDSVIVKDVEESTQSPRFGQPLTYEVIIGEDSRRQTKVVHYSRIVHIVDKPLQGQLYGEPRLAQVYNVLDDLLKMTGGSAELYWLTANRGMQVDVDKEMELTPADAKALSEELDEFQHQLRRYVRTRGVKIENLGGDVADPRGVFETLMAVLAGTTSIPQRILMGSEAGQLASEQDRANWAEYINRRRTTFAEPWVLKPVLRKLGEIGYLPADVWEKVEFEWPEAFHMNPVEEANASASKARAVANLSRRTQFGNPIVTDKEARVMVGLEPDLDKGDELPEAYVDPRTAALGGSGSGSSGSNPGEAAGAGSGGANDATDSPTAITRDPGEGNRNSQPVQ